ncbi:beta-propeller domain-containing protein [Solirubrobacter ginsenosidimutans]|uniref:Beta-propeller domain-containing protein n=1 Tax=Solirubrobacter ginsenosidimutans TaxID=490573 RepID=A0A9X3N1G6_9ACTN|nr:beta-propeller domain-containing protein [Solirubrobacter ginsenosidimutans]MDA0163223.1 beta-propeller domain-containing protein [Solirubrobacter ginsenosidimutans]
MRRLAAAVPLILALVAVDSAHAAPKAKPRLKAFSSCQSLVDYARQGALRTDGGVGVVGRAVPSPPVTIATPPLMPAPTSDTTVGGIVPPAPAAAPVSAEGGTEVGGTIPDFSGTNTQETDVDEPDVIKTDGRRIFTVTDGTLRVIDPSGVVTGTLALDGNEHRLLLRGNRVLVIANKGATPTSVPEGVAIAPTVAPLSSTTIVTEIDVSGAPKVSRTMEVPGRFVDARQNGAVARLVIDAVPQPIIPPEGESVDDAVDETTLGDFLGRTVLKSNLSGKTFRRNLAPCDAVTHPNQFSGLDVLAILTVDLDRGMYSLDRDGVMAGAQVVYGSAGSLYVASQRYVRALELGTDVPEGMRTEIHRFDVSDPTKTVYKASGSVPGFILNSYALSEFNGDLRVASTDVPPWQPGGTAVAPSSRVTVLRQDGAKLNQVGAVGGLGENERIYGVRFMGERGYVVTFRQVDPLYTLDLSDPTMPKVVGELKIPGYSAYLHPVGENLLLGVGRDGGNVKTSLFDVSNLAAPREVTNLQFPSSSTSVEAEPHAFLFWAPKKLVVMPLQSYSPPFTGAVGIHVEPNALSEVGRIVHHVDARPENAPVERSLVIGDKLYSLSYLGLSTTSVDTLAWQGYTVF